MSRNVIYHQLVSFQIGIGTTHAKSPPNAHLPSPDTPSVALDDVRLRLTSPAVLEADGQAALARYFQSGGVYTGVHAASACLFNDTNYLNVVGAYFDFHPSLQNATFVPTTRDHPATADVPDQWRFEEEVYHFRSDPRTLGAQVILTVDEDSYNREFKWSKGWVWRDS
jgi:hypothetical protein